MSNINIMYTNYLYIKQPHLAFQSHHIKISSLHACFHSLATIQLTCIKHQTPPTYHAVQIFS
jgi:hypothetical protein